MGIVLFTAGINIPLRGSDHNWSGKTHHHLHLGVTCISNHCDHISKRSLISQEHTSFTLVYWFIGSWHKTNKQKNTFLNTLFKMLFFVYASHNLPLHVDVMKRGHISQFNLYAYFTVTQFKTYIFAQFIIDRWVKLLLHCKDL